MPAVLHVALPVPLPQVFDYLPLATDLAVIGGRVRVPFGSGQRVGLVVGRGDHSTIAATQLKPVSAVLDTAPLLNAELLTSLDWAKEYWLGTPGDVFLGALPTALRGARHLPEAQGRDWGLTALGHAALAAGSRRGRSHDLLMALRDAPADAAALDLLVPGWRPAARRLLAAQLLHRPAHTDATHATLCAPTLTDEQALAVAAVVDHGDRYGAFLLDGVTGSGKTEVYLALIERALAAGRQSLLLVPEIGLAPQTLRRLTQRLGVRVDVLHSNLAEGDRARAWLRARDGHARVIIGTRSAVFTPLPRGGLMIVDEEHDGSYKQQDGFRYHARDLAVIRARALNIPLLLGSATPSLESLANVAAGRYQHLRLTQRPMQRPAPQIRVLDLRGPHLQNGLSATLLEALDACIEHGEQALVFRNRRGFSAVLMCHACGWHAACTRCDKPLTVHAASARLICHHCGHQQRLPAACPQCGYTDLHRQGFGTERLEQALQARYPHVPIIRIDSETTRRRDAFERLLSPLDQGGPAILVGTQMLAKGHDLPGRTLVAISSVDEGLYSVDFRANE
ncbi:MAG: primosomal protein N', partial [Xanthomonadales bacterium]|nr:primosomal protein N' [Xanthomonadales bacterium]